MPLLAPLHGVAIAAATQSSQQTWVTGIVARVPADPAADGIAMFEQDGRDVSAAAIPRSR